MAVPWCYWWPWLGFACWPSGITACRQPSSGLWCGGRLLAPPSLFERRLVLGCCYALAGGLAIASFTLRLTTVWLAIWDRALAFWGLSPQQLHAPEQLRQLRQQLSAAQASLPSPPEAQRLATRERLNPPGTAPVLESCWSTTDSLTRVMAFFREALPGAGWKLLYETPPGGGAVLAAQRGHIRLLVESPGHDRSPSPEPACPPGTTYTMSLTAVVSWAEPNTPGP